MSESVKLAWLLTGGVAEEWMTFDMGRTCKTCGEFENSLFDVKGCEF